MGTVGAGKEAMTDAERERAELFEQAHLGFVQTLTNDAVVTQEGVYANLAEQRRTENLRAEDEVAVQDTEDPPTQNTPPTRKRKGQSGDEDGGNNS